VQKTAILFKQGRKSRLVGAGTYPTEFFYGYVQLAAAGLPVEMLDEDELGLTDRFGSLWRATSIASYAVAGVHLWAVRRLAGARARDLLNRYSVLVATTNTQGFSLALLKRLGLIEPRVVFIAMGAVELASNPLRRWFCRRILRGAEIVVISKGEQVRMRQLVGERPVVSYVTFGVDARFWIPGEDGVSGNEPYVLSIGNDPHRDYATLVAAWRADFPKLKIVTRQRVTAPAPNVEVIAGDWRSQLLTDAQIRALVRGARFVVLPIRETAQPSGQSVCLQAMACGKAVVISDIAGIWDRELIVHGRNCLLVPCGSSDALRAEIARLLDDPERAAAIGRSARKVVESHLSVETMAEAMRQVIEAEPDAFRAPEEALA
jgi:glycosyltransferase involved in cell wall biosynthesis